MQHITELCLSSTYDLGTFPFPSVVADLLDCASLDRLHERHPMPPETHGDQDTPVHRMFYRRYPRMRELYERFLEEVIAPRYDDDLCVQRVPTFRVHYPGATAVGAFHRDSDYHHQSGTVNYWLPLTPAFATNSIWIETEPDSEQYAPVDLLPGELLRFDAVRLRHGNHPNDTPVTRVSVDFRVLPLQDYRDAGLSTVSNRVPLRLAGYYGLLRRGGRLEHVPDRR